MEAVKKYELRPLADENVTKLLEVLENFLPDSAVAYYSIKKQSHWSKKTPGMKSIVLCPNGDWRNGTMVQLTDGLALDKIFGTLYAKEGELDVLEACLEQTDLIEWDRLMLFTAVPNRCVPLLQTVLRNKGFTDRENYKEFCLMNFMRPEDVKQIKATAVPDSLRIGKLEEHHLQVVCDNWGYFTPVWEPMILKMIELNFCFGVFVKNDIGEEELVSWVLESEYGGIGLVTTLPEHRRKGFSTLLVNKIAKCLGESGAMPFGMQLTKNVDSTSLFGRTGFKRGGFHQWVYLAKI